MLCVLAGQGAVLLVSQGVPENHAVVGLEH